jgi:hypothetical protein
MTPTPDSAKPVVTTERVTKRYTSYSTNPWVWTKDREKAAQMVADVQWTGEDIGEKVGVHRVTIERWKRCPEFQERVTQIIDSYKTKIRRQGQAIKERRVQSLIDDFNATTRILRERGLDAEWMDEHGNVNSDGGPGGVTGFIAREYQDRKSVYKFDAALMKSRMELRRQIAIELGEWEEKTAIEHSGEIKLPTAKLADADIEREIRTIGASLGLIAQPEAQTLVEGEDGVFEEQKAGDPAADEAAEEPKDA